MQLFEQFIALIAPHYCIECGQEGQLLCLGCAPEAFAETPQGCALCDIPTKDAAVCNKCRRMTSLTHLWALGPYDNVLQRLIQSYKFTPARAASKIIAQGITSILPVLPPSTIIVPLPTAPSRVRQRGFDQTVLIAKELAKQRKLRYVPLLYRRHNFRQVGATKQCRELQAASAYGLKRSFATKANPVLLIDDVITTGASLKAAAQLLNKAGYTQIFAATAAKQAFKK